MAGANVRSLAHTRELLLHHGVVVEPLCCRGGIPGDVITSLRQAPVGLAGYLAPGVVRGKVPATTEACG